MTYTNDYYLKNKERITNATKKWLAKQDDDYFVKSQAKCRLSVRNHYKLNKEKISEYKRKHHAFKTEAKRLLNMYESLLS